VAGPGPAAASRKPEFDRRNVKITRILTVCEVYDALVSARVYWPAWSEEGARSSGARRVRRSTRAASTW
jgi:hypothetical protein